MGKQTEIWRSELDPERIVQTVVSHWQEAEYCEREDVLAVEEPFEVRINGESLAVIMRTPGHDRELALGFLFSEGVISASRDVLNIESAVDADGLPLANAVNVRLQNSGGMACEHESGATFTRHFAVASSCGLCGKNSIASLFQANDPLDNDELRVPISILYDLARQLRDQQAVFSHTGGLHAAGLFSLTGELQLLREDIGRHNAVDKLIGHGLLHNDFPYRERLLLVSGRTSFEIIQKALQAHIPYVIAISAPSSLAVELAEKSNITLVGFLRGHSLNIYTHAERVI
ncbi:formate dehydrogenase accessory sulfurtransferase FdhD [Ktedonospora formicarum]|uniref:Sulfur carrier protein FdhD n=1 Tax=Ktedonospora formicarum TaxID=2778364 RepID=A0A8J3I0B0_9CHLR|nr:formate dehydrogenase accessory sulfurtransferase FdhD [Ktedonospora formicarum]GHO43758.1 sulfurtransferase FdhD [Ktedonospora formicarum]